MSGSRTSQRDAGRLAGDEGVGLKRPTSLRARALRMLARRDHSRQELSRKLDPHASHPEELDALLDDLQASGWLSEQRLADQFVRAAAGRYGARKVLQQLRDKGVSPKVMALALVQVREAEPESATAVWRKRFGRQPSDLRERARQARFLEQRGFDPDVIRRVLGGGREE